MTDKKIIDSSLKKDQEGEMKAKHKAPTVRKKTAKK